MSPHEYVVHHFDAATGLRSIVAIHSTALGPALGGVRFHPYRSEDDALADVLRLSAGMTAKAALAGLDLGGGKAVILGDPRHERSDALLRAFGRFVDSLSGRYVTAEDVGTTAADMDCIGAETRHVSGRSPDAGGNGDPSASTALGVFIALQAAARHRWPDSSPGGSIVGRRVAIGGVGKVGSNLAARLAEAGASLVIADPDPRATARVARATGAAVVAPEDIHRARCDIFAPCALGGVLTPRTVAELRCDIVVGAANNQLADDSVADAMAAAGILYVPDFVANAGGLIHVAAEYTGLPSSIVEPRIRGIGATVTTVLELADRYGETTTATAARLVEARLARADAIRPREGCVPS
jgi:glutamate dehydrogenase/leucine dehydrogenase